MKSALFPALLAVSMFAPLLRGQESAPGENPASREEILQLFDAMHTRDASRQVMQVFVTQMRSLAGTRTSAGSSEISSRLDNLFQEMIESYPIEEVIEDMVPVYQSHFSSNDVDAMVRFYSTPTGQKVIRERPVIAAESMQASQPRMQQHMQSFQEKLRDLLQEIMEESIPQSAPVY